MFLTLTYLLPLLFLMPIIIFGIKIQIVEILILIPVTTVGEEVDAVAEAMHKKWGA